MLFTKLNTLILIFNTLHFSIKFVLKNKKKINDIKDFCNMFMFILCIIIICSLNINDDFLLFKKLQVHLII